MRPWVMPSRQREGMRIPSSERAGRMMMGCLPASRMRRYSCSTGE